MFGPVHHALHCLSMQWNMDHSNMLPEAFIRAQYQHRKKMPRQIIHPVHESELWFPAVLISLSNPSTASPRCEGDMSPAMNSALGPMLRSWPWRITVAGGLLSCIGDPRFLGGVRCACFCVRGWTMLEDSGDGWPGRSGVLWKGVDVNPAVPTRGVCI